jgi:hypothetical protein
MSKLKFGGRCAHDLFGMSFFSEEDQPGPQL